MGDRTHEYHDRVTGADYATARAMVDDYIARFSATVSAAAGATIAFAPLDEDGFSCVTRGSATVGINVLEKEDVLLFLARIMTVPDERREELYRRLLELNYTATSEGAFAVDRETETISLRALRSLCGLDYEEFESMLHTMAVVADEWDDELMAEFGGH
ncbi:MAG: YbjN domain-containing protein [Deltaproteobacteria bacterium]|nr:YbjN domain-containing protein [Deltaproteobacteria bacterium]